MKSRSWMDLGKRGNRMLAPPDICILSFVLIGGKECENSFDFTDEKTGQQLIQGYKA